MNELAHPSLIMAAEAIFQSIDRHPFEKSCLPDLLLENAYDSNLLPDTANVEYLAGYLGWKNLQPLHDLPSFMDELYFLFI